MMRKTLSFVGAALLAGALSLGAQERYSADFTSARRYFVENQQPKAAYTVGVASAYVRQEIGRCKDAGVGERLMAAEDRLDRLVARLRGNGVASVATLDSAFAQTDRLLAEHHWRLAAWGLANLAQTTRATVGTDLGAAATLLAQSYRFSHTEPAPAAETAMATARRVADTIAATDALPRETAAAIEALGRVIAPPAVIANR